MPAATTEQRALDLVRQLSKDGQTIRRVVVEGRKITIELASAEPVQKIDEVKW
jgi:hypothetical protein